MMDLKPAAFSSYSPSTLWKEFGIARREKLAIGALDCVFNHFSGQNAAMGARAQRFKLSLKQSEQHVKLRLAVHDAYVLNFFENSPRYLRGRPLRLAVICGEEILEKIKDSDLTENGVCLADARKYIQAARRIQTEANFIRHSSDLDYKPVRTIEDAIRPSRDAAFLAHIDLFSRIFAVKWEANMDYDALSDHLRYDLICAPRYLDTDTVCGHAIAGALDEWEYQIVESLKERSPMTNLEIVSMPARAPDVIAFPGPRR